LESLELELFSVPAFLSFSSSFKSSLSSPLFSSSLLSVTSLLDFLFSFLFDFLLSIFFGLLSKSSLSFESSSLSESGSLAAFLSTLL